MRWIALSDLHISGKPGQFQAHEMLGEFLARQANAGGPVGLILAGDVFDFLEFEHSDEIIPEKAPARLEAMLGAPSNEPIIAGLKKILGAGRMVVLPGNHDLELDLTEVQDKMRSCLGAGDRLEFVRGGEPFELGSGAAKAWIIHGNKLDAWNDIDYPAFRLQAEREPAKPQKPCPGSRLVVRLMNVFKPDYPWIDRIPHLPTTLVLLWYFENGSARLKDALRDSTGIGVDLLLTILRRARRGGQLALNAPTADALADSLVQSFSPERTRAVRPEQWSWMESVLQGSAPAISKPEALAAGGGSRYWISTLRHLLEASRPARIEQADVTHEDPNEKLLAKRAPRDAAVVIMGHTHIQKDRPLLAGRYFNLGSWGQQLDIPEFDTDADVEAWLGRLKDNQVESKLIPTFLELDDRDATMKPALRRADA